MLLLTKGCVAVSFYTEWQSAFFPIQISLEVTNITTDHSPLLPLLCTLWITDICSQNANLLQMLSVRSTQGYAIALNKWPLGSSTPLSRRHFVPCGACSMQIFPFLSFPPKKGILYFYFISQEKQLTVSNPFFILIGFPAVFVAAWAAVRAAMADAR